MAKHNLERVRRWFRNRKAGLFDRLSALNPIVAFLGCFLSSISLLMVSFPLGIGQVTQSEIVAGLPPKEVGYAALPNWGFLYTAIFPCAVFSLLTMSQRVSAAFGSMAERGMFVNENWETMSSQDVLALWRGSLAKVERYAWLLILVAVVSSFGEWAVSSGVPLWMDDLPGWKIEVDWSVALVKHHWGMRVLNGGFSLLAFALQALAFAALGVYLVFVVTLIQFRETASIGGAFRIIPDPDGLDTRKGFERLEPALVHVFHVGLLTLGMLYLVRYSNAYLDDAGESFWKFVSRDLTLGLTDTFDVRSIALWLQGLNVGPINFGIALSVIMGTLVAVCIFVLPSVFLRNGARESCDTLLEQAMRKGGFRGRTVEDISARLKGMVFWPTTYVSSALLSLLVLLSVFCLVCYQLGPIVLSIVLAAVMTRIAFALRAVLR